MKPKETRRLDVKKLRVERYQVAYQDEVTKRITDLDLEEGSFVEEGWASWRDAVMGAAEDWISRKTENLVR